MKAVVVRFLFVLSTFLYTASPGGAQAPQGALATDERQGDQYGWAVNYETAGAARRRALSECGSRCSVVLTFERCAAYAVDQDAGSTAFGWAESYDSAAGARQRALAECGSRGGSRCTVRAWGCNGHVVEESLGLGGAARREIQESLQAAGFDPGGADGLFGPRTRAAIRSWQTSRGTRATGYLDNASAAALRPSAVAVPTFRERSAAAAVGVPAAVPEEQQAALVGQPASSSVASAELEALFWQSIVDSENPTDFEAYLAQFPNGVFRRLAENRLSALQPAPPASASAAPEALFWQSVVNSENPADFEAYLAQFPNGVFRRLAENRLSALQSPSDPPVGVSGRPSNDTDSPASDSDVQAELLREASSPSEAHARNVVSTSAPVAGGAIAQPVSSSAETVFWRSVMSSTNPEELEAYLLQFPNGVFRALAEVRLASLRGRERDQSPAGQAAGAEKSLRAAGAEGSATKSSPAAAPAAARLAISPPPPVRPPSSSTPAATPLSDLATNAPRLRSPSTQQESAISFPAPEQCVLARVSAAPTYNSYLDAWVATVEFTNRCAPVTYNIGRFTDEVELFVFTVLRSSLGERNEPARLVEIGVTRSAIALRSGETDGYTINVFTNRSVAVPNPIAVWCATWTHRDYEQRARCDGGQSNPGLDSNPDFSPSTANYRQLDYN